jgi:hypothetical protein
MLLCAALVAIVMVPVSIVLAAGGILVLQLAGGAARDTSLVVTIAAVLVTDFWAGGIIRALTRTDSRDVAIVWGIARAIVLVIAALLVYRLAIVAPIQLALAIPAAYLGATVGKRQSQLRATVRDAEARAVERDRQRRARSTVGI